MAEKNGHSTPVCDFHEKYEKWNDERWEDQKKVNETLFGICKEMSTSINGLKERISYATGAIAVVIVLAPFFWKLISNVLGIKP